MDTAESLLSEALDLCVRANKLDAQQRANTEHAASMKPEDWDADRFARHAMRHNIKHPEIPMETAVKLIPKWVEDHYATDLADWQKRARAFLMRTTA